MIERDEAIPGVRVAARRAARAFALYELMYLGGAPTVVLDPCDAESYPARVSPETPETMFASALEVERAWLSGAVTHDSVRSVRDGDLVSRVGSSGPWFGPLERVGEPFLRDVGTDVRLRRSPVSDGGTVAETTHTYAGDEYVYILRVPRGRR